MSLAVLVARWRLPDERVARRIVTRLVAGGWLRPLQFPQARFGLWCPTTKLIADATGKRVSWQARRPWHPLAVTATLVGAELVGWETRTDMEMMRFNGPIDDPARLDLHPWTVTCGDGRRHLPDIVLSHPSVRLPVAVEVELTRKNPARLRAILDAFNLSRRYGEVWYVVGDEQLGQYVIAQGARLVPPAGKLRVFVSEQHWVPPTLPSAAIASAVPPPPTNPVAWPAPTGAAPSD